MKVIGKSALWVLAVGLALWNCSTHKAVNWKEMDDFHMILAEAYHPFKDSGNLAPAKELAQELSNSASAWAASPIPKNVDAGRVQPMLVDLLNKAFKVNIHVKAPAPDTLIGISLTELHDSFHQVMEATQGGHEGHKK